MRSVATTPSSILPSTVRFISLGWRAISPSSRVRAAAKSASDIGFAGSNRAVSSCTMPAATPIDSSANPWMRSRVHRKRFCGDSTWCAMLQSATTASAWSIESDGCRPERSSDLSSTHLMRRRSRTTAAQVSLAALIALPSAPCTT